MTTSTTPNPAQTQAATPVDLPAYVAGEAVSGGDTVDVYYPWNNSLTGRCGVLSPADVNHAIETAYRARTDPAARLSKHARSEVLSRARQLLTARADEFADLIRLESGLCDRETRYEVGRAQDVLRFAAAQALSDDGRVLSGDVSASPKPRRIYTHREPVDLVLAITPFNHPLNQVAHKLAPAIAAGAPVILKPSEKTPLTAVRLTELLYEAGLPGWMLSVGLADIAGTLEPAIRDERIPLVTFTGGTSVGKRIASIAGYKKLCLELGGNAPLIVLPDADLDLAALLACEGNFRNSGQRCTAVKRTLVHRDVYEPFLERFTALARGYTAGDPADPATRVGTVIDEPAAKMLERRARDAQAAGATILVGGQRDGALLHPTVLRDVPRDAEIVVEESFGPVAPVIPVDDLQDAIAYTNKDRFALSAAVVTDSLDAAMHAVARLHAPTVNINEVPGFRTETSPFGGTKDSGLGIKEGVEEAAKFMTTVKTYSLPWPA